MYRYYIHVYICDAFLYTHTLRRFARIMTHHHCWIRFYWSVHSEPIVLSPVPPLKSLWKWQTILTNEHLQKEKNHTSPWKFAREAHLILGICIHWPTDTCNHPWQGMLRTFSMWCPNWRGRARRMPSLKNECSRWGGCHAESWWLKNSKIVWKDWMKNPEANPVGDFSHSI